MSGRRYMLATRGSHAAGRRLYKAVVIVDLLGLSLSHTKPNALRIFQLLISKFQVS